MIDEKKTTTGFCQRLFLNYSPNFLRNIIKSTAPIIRMADAAIITMFKMEICPEDVFCEFSEIPDVVATFSVGEKVDSAVLFVPVALEVSLFTCVAFALPELGMVLLLFEVVVALAVLMGKAVVFGVVRFVVYCLSIAVSFCAAVSCASFVRWTPSVVFLQLIQPRVSIKKMELSPSFIRDCTAL